MSLRRALVHRFRHFAVAALCFTGLSRSLEAQDSVAAEPGATAKGVALAAGQTLLTNIVINRFNVWVLGLDWARVNPDTWGDNLRAGWDWDQDKFTINMLGHPYQGALYYGAARSHGLNYWASAPFTVLGSVTWEYFGENTTPSLNDLINTTLGGAALGEMFHRVASTIRDNTTSGQSRLARELFALPFDPVGGLNRLVRGQWTRLGPNPATHDPVALVARLGVGAGVIRNVEGSDADFSGLVILDVDYGDPFLEISRAPFDAFSLRVQFNPGQGTLTQLRGVGRLRGRRGVGNTGEPHRVQWEINQRFAYFNNPAYEFGGQTFQLAMVSRFPIVGNLGFRARLATEAIVLAGIEAPSAGVGQRGYDFGPGVGAAVTGTLEHRGVPYLSVHFEPSYVHSLSGAEADHYAAFTSVEGYLSVGRGIGLAAHGSLYNRSSRYSDLPRENRSIPELRIFAWIKTVSRPDEAPESNGTR